MYRIIVEEFIASSEPNSTETRERYRQSVEMLNLPGLIAAVNKPARAPRKDKGIRKGEAA